MLRKTSGLTLEALSSIFGVDKALLSKYERGERKPLRGFVEQAAQYFNQNIEELTTLWLTDKILWEAGQEDNGPQALQLAEDQMALYKVNIKSNQEIIDELRNLLKTFNSISQAWIYGSFARGDDTATSDIDIAISAKDTFSYFDLAEVEHILQNALQRKIDIGFISAFKPGIRTRIQNDLKMIYER